MSQAQIAAKRSIAKSFASEVEMPRGTESAANSLNRKTKLVEAELEVVRTPWLLQCGGIARRFRWRSHLDRIQRSEIERRLQRRYGESKDASCGHRSPWFTDHRRISCFGKHKR